MTFLHSAKFLAQTRTHGAHMVQKTLCQNDIEHSIANRHSQRIAAIGRAMRAGDHALARFFRRQTGAKRKTAADALGNAHNIRRHARPFMREEFARAADTCLHFVEHQQEAVLIAELAQAFETLRRHGADAALALDRLDQDRARLRTNGLFQSLMIAEGHLIKAVNGRAEAFEIFLVAAGRDGRQRAPVEGPFKSDDPVFFRMSAGGLIFARHFDRQFHRLGAGIGEEDEIRERFVDKTLRQPLAFRDLEEIGRVPELFGLLRQRFHQMGMRIAKARHSNAAAEIEISLPANCRQPSAFALFKGEVITRIGRQKRRGHRRFSSQIVGGLKRKEPPQRAATCESSVVSRASPVK